jgi:hypothetical protein
MSVVHIFEHGYIRELEDGNNGKKNLVMFAFLSLCLAIHNKRTVGALPVVNIGGNIQAYAPQLTVLIRTKPGIAGAGQEYFHRVSKKIKRVQQLLKMSFKA